jgi:phosphate-selective porin OprO and OprP
MSRIRWYRNIMVVASLSLVGTAPQLLAQQDSSAAAAVDLRVDSLDQQLRILARKWELYQDSVATAAKIKASVTAGPGGFQLKSADGNFVLKLGGYLQVDSRFYENDDALLAADQWLIRRARLVFEGTVFKIFDFRIMPDFAGATPTIFDAYFEARLAPAVALRAGKYKPPLGLERLQSARDLLFVERGFPTNLVPTRDIGLQLGGELGKGILTYAVGVFNGVPDLANDNVDLGDSKEVDGRIFLTPFQSQDPHQPVDLGIGIGGGTGKVQGSTTLPDLPSYRSPGQLIIYRYRVDLVNPATGTTYGKGTHTRIDPQAYLYKGPFGFLTEYYISRQSVTRDTGSVTLTQSAWQVEGSVFLTGERASFKTVSPKKTFDPAHGAWGGVQLAARYGEIHFDDDAFPYFVNPANSISDAKSWGVGVNWYLARYVKIQVNYEHTTFTLGATTGNRPDENFLVAQVQTAF